jgi:hypothetical protein
MKGWGGRLVRLFEQMWDASRDSRWAKDRAARKRKEPKKKRDVDPLAAIVTHLDDAQAGKTELFKEDYIEHNLHLLMHSLGSRCFLLVLRTFADAAKVANMLLQEDTRYAIAYNKVDEPTMAASLYYLFRLPTPKTSDTPAPADDTKYIMTIVLPTGTQYSSTMFFTSIKDITPLGCILPAFFATQITKTGWLSLQKENRGKWMPIGLGTDEAQDPFLMCTSVAEASKPKLDAPPSAEARPAATSSTSTTPGATATTCSTTPKATSPGARPFRRKRKYYERPTLDEALKAAAIPREEQTDKQKHAARTLPILQNSKDIGDDDAILQASTDFPEEGDSAGDEEKLRK